MLVLCSSIYQYNNVRDNNFSVVDNGYRRDMNFIIKPMIDIF